MWLYVPSASAREEEGSIWESDSLYQELAQSATWSGKLLLPRSWRRVCAKARWLRLLSGLTSTPSTRDRGAAAWISSLVASPVRDGATPASGRANSTRAISGPELAGWYESFHRDSSSSRTFQASFLTSTPTYDPTFRPWATRLRRASSQRRRLARRTFGSGSSSWPSPQVFDETDLQRSDEAYQRSKLKGGTRNLREEVVRSWPSPQSADGERASETLYRGEENPTLLGAARSWPTPDTAPEAPNANSNKVNGPKALGEAARLWPTAQAHDERERGNTEADHHHYPHDLSNAASMWRSPAAQKSGISADRLEGEIGSRMYDKETGRLTQYGNSQLAELWQTPKAPTGGNISRGHDRADEPLLAGQAKMWATPQGHDGRRPGSDATSSQEYNLKRQVEADFSLPAQATAQAGQAGSGTTPALSRPVLNPRFVEALMGWPQGWVSLAAPTSSASWGTASSRLLRRLLSARSGRS